MIRSHDKLKPRITAFKTTKTKVELCHGKLIPLLPDEILRLDILSRDIMGLREDKSNALRERITANSIIRCLIGNFLEKSPLFNLEGINNETELYKRVKRLFK